MSKAIKRNQRGIRPRTRPTREIRQRFLIVCEGEKTEPNYFLEYRQLASVIAMDIHGASADPLSVVEYASREVERVRLREGLSTKAKPYDHIWCVFDRDNWPTQLFNEALSQAHLRGFKVAYSNQAFELWYVLHFQYLNTSIPRADYIRQLSDLLSTPYKKNSPTMFTALRPRQQIAIKNAERLLSQYTTVAPAHDDPSTTVHLLISELNRFVS